MKNIAAKLFLTVMTVTAFSAAAVAKTTGNDSMVDYFTMASGGESTSSAFREPTNNDLINSFLGGLECWEVKQKYKKGRLVSEVSVRVPCPK